MLTSWGGMFSLLIRMHIAVKVCVLYGSWRGLRLKFLIIYVHAL